MSAVEMSSSSSLSSNFASESISLVGSQLRTYSSTENPSEEVETVRPRPGPGLIAPPPRESSTSIRERDDGTVRVFMQKSFWDHGVLRGVYYCFIYWFHLGEAQKAIMSQIYANVKEAVLHRVNVTIEECAQRFSTAPEAPLAALFGDRYDMVVHALGNEELAFHLLIDSIQLRRTNGRATCSDLYKVLIQRILGVGYLADISREYFLSNLAWLRRPRDVDNSTLPPRSVKEILTACVQKAREHPCQDKIKGLFGDGANGTANIARNILIVIQENVHAFATNMRDVRFLIDEDADYVRLIKQQLSSDGLAAFPFVENEDNSEVAITSAT